MSVKLILVHNHYKKNQTSTIFLLQSPATGIYRKTYIKLVNVDGQFLL